MVSKLLLAVQECCLKAIDKEADEGVIGRLLDHYYEIDAGIGVHKSPKLYGAFPTDPYSHTPLHRGAQQPGMTGQVKEDILSRFGELGVFVHNGQIHFNPCLLRKKWLLTEAKSIEYLDIRNERHSLQLEPGSLFFTYCQTPVIYRVSDKEGLEVTFSDGTATSFDTLFLDHESSRHVFQRTGMVQRIVVNVKETRLK